MVHQVGEFRIALRDDNAHERKYAELLANNQGDIDYAIARHFVRPGDSVLDAGAHIGFTSLRYVQLGASHVYAFEPVSYLFARLEDLQCPKVHAFPFALSDHIGLSPIYLSQRHTQGNTLSTEMRDYFPGLFDHGRAEEVQLTTIDHILPRTHFQFAKIDVEGAEASVLRGARETFASGKPRAIQLEIYPPVFEETDAEASRFYDYRYRVAYTLNSMECVFLAQGTPESSHPDLASIPPTYVYTDTTFHPVS
ncbi:MAG TPA: FkbM family methyltransferase [Phycisphaerae bacterium]|nr:FkbM family methyltransferase [Phycisphaerae bacterium]